MNYGARFANGSIESVGGNARRAAWAMDPHRLRGSRPVDYRWIVSWHDGAKWQPVKRYHNQALAFEQASAVANAFRRKVYVFGPPPDRTLDVLYPA